MINHRYHIQKVFLGGTRLTKYGSNIPLKPTIITASSFVISISHITEGIGNKRKSHTCRPKIIAAHVCPSSCRNGYKNIAVSNPTASRPKYFNASFIFITLFIFTHYSQSYSPRRYLWNSSRRSSVRVSIYSWIIGSWRRSSAALLALTAD